MEDTYRASLLKSFKKNIDDGFFPFIIVDAVNQKLKHFEEFWAYAKSKGFQVYIGDVMADPQVCEKRNTHNRTEDDIILIIEGFDDTPLKYLQLDLRSLLQDDAITEVEMEDTTGEKKEENASEYIKSDSDAEVDESVEDKWGYQKSKWEIDTSESQLEKLDGIKKAHKHFQSPHRMEDFLELSEDYSSRFSEPGKKRVRWADMEERKDQQWKRDLGFVVGQTADDWEKMTDDDYADKALNRMKYF